MKIAFSILSNICHIYRLIRVYENILVCYFQEFGVIRPIVSSTPVPGVIGESREEINLEINGINGTLTNGTGLDKKKYNKCARGDL